jgi:hypothetical protein
MPVPAMNDHCTPQHGAASGARPPLIPPRPATALGGVLLVILIILVGLILGLPETGLGG